MIKSILFFFFMSLIMLPALSQKLIEDITNNDSINKYDSRGKEVGLWVDIKGDWHYYFFNEQGCYIDGKRDGYWVRFDRNTKLILADMHYLNGELDGVMTVYKKGKISEILHYTNGKLNGVQKKYSKSGELLVMYCYEDNIKKSIIYSKTKNPPPIDNLDNVNWRDSAIPD